MTEEVNRAQCAVLYLRVASARHGDAEAFISRQREACQRIAAKHGLVVVREYADVGRSARLEQQGELRRLLDDLATLRDASSVVVWDYARLAQDMAQLDEVINQVRVRGAEVVTMTGVEVAERFIRQQRSQAVIDEAPADLEHPRWPSDPQEPGAVHG